MVDFRKQLNGLIVLIVDALGKDPGSGELFIFRNHAGNKLKMVYFDGRCFWLVYCRLEKGRFKLPAFDSKRVAMLVIDFDPPWVKSTRKRDGAIFAADVLVTCTTRPNGRRSTGSQMTDAIV